MELEIEQLEDKGFKEILYNVLSKLITKDEIILQL